MLSHHHKQLIQQTGTEQNTNAYWKKTKETKAEVIIQDHRILELETLLDKKEVKGLVLGKNVGSKERSKKSRKNKMLSSCPFCSRPRNNSHFLCQRGHTSLHSLMLWFVWPKAIISLGGWLPRYLSDPPPQGAEQPNKLAILGSSHFSWTLIFHRTRPVIILDLRWFYPPSFFPESTEMITIIPFYR